MKAVCDVQSPELLNRVRAKMPQMREIVQSAAGRVAALARAHAPSKSGALRAGVVPSPWEEASRSPFKVGRQVYMDHRMNNTFVKTRKDGKRYYYPASQEYGFRVHSGHNAMRKVPGRYFMRTARNDSSTAFASDMEEFVQEVISE